MTTTLLHAERMLTPTAEITDAGILIRDGVIEELGLREGMRLPAGAEEISATDKTAIPGFVDVHIHGAGGRDVMEGSAEALAGVAKTVARHGTTSFVATTVTASPDDTIRNSTKRTTSGRKCWGSILKARFSARRGAECIRRNG
jgi:N-acetylglucosamine-6-phosphate deacetylase